MSESNSVIRLSESDAIEAGIIESSEFKYVVDEAIITCSNAEIENFPNNLMVDSQSKFYMHSRLVATKADSKPFININPFKCSCKFGECRPKFETTWENYVENITVAGNEPLCEKSILKCTRYDKVGIISIIDTGQRLISDEINEISEMLKNIAQQGGTKQERLQKMTDYLRKKYGKDVNVSDFNYENFGKGSVLDLTFGEDPIHFINNSEGEIFKHVDEYNKEGVFFKKERRRLNEAGQPRVYEDEIVGNFYTNSAQYKYIKTMSPQTIKKMTDGWQMEENERKKAVSAQHLVIDKLIKAPHTVEMTIDYNSLNTDVIYWSQPRELKKKEEAVQKKLEGITKIPGIEGVDVVGYKKDKNGNTVLVVRDYRNILNEKDKQGIWNEYRKRGIKIENDPIGMFNSTVHATNVYNYLGGSYNDKYADGGLIAPLSTGIGVGKSYVVTRSLKANGYINTTKGKTEQEIFYENMSERDKKFFKEFSKRAKSAGMKKENIRETYFRMRMKDYNGMAELLNFSTQEDKAVFWSKDKNGASEYAKSIGGKIMEHTQGGQIFDNWNMLNEMYPEWSEGSNPQNEIWKSISKRYANNTTGVVKYYNPTNELGNVWKNVEYPILRERLKKDLIDGILYLNPNSIKKGGK